MTKAELKAINDAQHNATQSEYTTIHDLPITPEEDEACKAMDKQKKEST